MADAWFRVFPPEQRDVRHLVGNPGPKHMPPPDAKPIVYFFLMFTLNLVKKFVIETNRYASQFIRSKVGRIGPRSRLHLWIKEGSVTVREFKGFLAVILNMGLIKKPTIEQYWRNKISQSTPWFRTMFTRNRFQLILKFLHLVDNRKINPPGHVGYNPAAKFQPLIDHLNMRSQYTYVPNQKLTVDESLVATKARSLMTQYIPTKHSKFGIKLWMLVEAVTGFIVRIIVYRGKRFDPVPAGRQQGTEVVHRLLSESSLLNKYYHVYHQSH